jgi:penicillin G amidase
MTWKDKLLFPFLGTLLKAALWPVSRARLPRINGRMAMDGLEEPVEIVRDSWGVPHIYARNVRDVVFAQGLVHAQERLWQMDLIRRVVTGRASEVLGEIAVPVDRGMRTLGLYITAAKEARSVSGELLSILDSYCCGVNAWIDLARKQKKFPLEFMLLGYQPEPWRIEDSLGWGKLLSWTLAANWQSELYRKMLIQRLGVEKVKELEIDIDQAWAVILDVGQVLTGKSELDGTRAFTGSSPLKGAGSNNWVVHGSRTVSGKPLLANDMHLELTFPGIWYENHLIGGNLDVTGVTFPGVPMVVAGHNRQVAWGFTDSCSDVQDLYEEHLRQTSDGGWEVEFNGNWQPALVRKEEILIKGGGKVEEDVVVTPHGPIINTLFKKAFPEAPPLALRWTALDPDDTFQAVLDMNMAGDCLEFKEALRHFDNPSQNIVFADTQGNIAYTMNGRVPIRAKGDGTIPSPGWNGEYEWKGYIPFDELPHLFNPSMGFVATANNQVNRPDFPHFLGRDFLVSERAGRIVELLKAREKIDIPYIQQMQSDQVAISSRIFKHYLAGLKVPDPELRFIVETMRAWDGKLDIESWPATIFEATSRQAISLMLEHWLGELGKRVQGSGPFPGQWPQHTWEWFIHLLDKPDSPWFDLGGGQKRDDVLILALQRSLESLKRELGPRKQAWKWGNLHQLTFGHILGQSILLGRVFNLGPFSMGGDGNTIWASFTSYFDLKRRPMTGPPFRFIADLGDLDHCWGALVPGQSGNLSSPHQADGIRPWLKGEYHPMLFCRAEVEQNVEARLLIVPSAEGVH